VVVQGPRLVTGLAATFGMLTVVLVSLGLVYSPMVLLPAGLFLVVTYLLWYHASGRLAGRIYRGVERQARRNGAGRQERGGFGADPREEWTGPRRGRANPGGRQRTGTGARTGTAGGRGRGSAATTDAGPSPTEAYEALDLDPGADEAAVRRAYRKKVKQVHPDADGGNRERFKRVNEAYERLADEPGTAK